MTDPTKLALSFDPTQQRVTGWTAHGNHKIDCPFITEVIPGLWQGGCNSGLVLPRNFKHLVSLYPWERYTLRQELDTEVYVRAYDSTDQPFEQLDWVAGVVGDLMGSGDILVHCQAGLNRSSFVVANVLLSLGMADPISHLRKVRSPAVLCNPAFEQEIRSRMT